jgi:hypothetical protein
MSEKLSIKKIKGLNSLIYSQGGETSIKDLIKYFNCDEKSFDTIIKPYIDYGFISTWEDSGYKKNGKPLRMFIIHTEWIDIGNELPIN